MYKFIVDLCEQLIQSCGCGSLILCIQLSLSLSVSPCINAVDRKDKLTIVEAVE